MYIHFIRCIAIFLFVTNSLAVSLRQVIDHTLSTNPTILEAIQQYNADLEGVRQAKGLHLPRINISGSYGYQKSVNNNTNFQEKDLMSKQLALNLEENIFSGFRIKEEITRSQAIANSSRFKLQAIINDTTLNASEAYANVLRENYLVKIEKDNVRTHTKLLGLIKKRYHAGLLLKSQLAQTEGRLERARANLAAEENNLFNAKTILYQITGMQGNSLSYNLEIPNHLIPHSMQRVIKISVRTNPLIKAARTGVTEKIASHKTAKSVFYPHLELVGNTTLGEDISGVKGVNNSYTVSLNLDYNLFHGWRDIHQLKKTAYEIVGAKDKLDQVKRKLVERIELSWFSYQQLRKQIIYLKENALKVKETVRMFKYQYLNKKRTLYDLLNIEHEYFNAQSAYTNAKYNSIIAQYRILNTMNKLTKFILKSK